MKSRSKTCACTWASLAAAPCLFPFLSAFFLRRCACSFSLSYRCSDTCSSYGSTVSIKSFLGATWHFSFFDEAVSRDFVDSVRLGILACLSRNLSSKEEGSSSALFQAQQTSDVHTQRVDADVRISADEFATVSLGQVAGGDLPTRSPESNTASFSP